MSKGKSLKSVTFPTPTRFEWSKAYLVKPRDSLIAHRDSLLKQPFRPSYDMDGDPKMDCLMDWSYARIWQTEVENFRMCRRNSAREKSVKKKFPIYSNRKPKSVDPCMERYTIRRFQNVSAKVESRRAVPLRPFYTC